MDSLGLRPQDRKGYEAYIERRVLQLATKPGRKELETEWKALRRGWYVGGDRFLEKLEEYLARSMKGRRHESHSGAAKAAHGKAAATRALEQGLKVLGLKRADLEEMPRSTPEKMVLAWWLRQRTTVSLRWLSERLVMGHLSRVSQAVGQVKNHPTPLHQRLIRRLARTLGPSAL
jgi:hypothetical protein